MPNLGAPEILVIFVVALLVFGPQRLPEIGRQVAKGIRELRSFQQNLRDEMDEAFSVREGDAEPEAAVEPPPMSAGPDATPKPGEDPPAGTTS
jgi:sec-independent protein translocase protein TatA